jgi:RNA polymerase sigma factor (sigma-70 family)
MSTVLIKHNALMVRIVREYGAMIRGDVDKALGGLPCADDVISEVHFAVFMTLRKLGDGWTPPRSFVSKVVRNHVNDLLWQKRWDRNDLEEIKKRQTEQAIQREDMIAQVHTLTPAEFKVFRLLGLGLTNQEIADSLYISPLTVRTHVKKLHAKCNIKGRAKLALTAYQVCYRELPESMDEGPGAGDHDSGGYMQHGMLSQQAS